MKIGLMLCGMVGLILGIIGCKPAAPAELESRVDTLEVRVDELGATLREVSASLDSLITAYEEHIKRHHPAAPAPRVPTPPKPELPPVRKK